MVGVLGTELVIVGELDWGEIGGTGRSGEGIWLVVEELCWCIGRELS